MEHHVYFWLKEGVDKSAFEQALGSLLAIEYISSGSWGKQASTSERPVTDKTWDYALSLKFDTIKNHDLYQADDQHDVFVEAQKDKWSKVLVMDME